MAGGTRRCCDCRGTVSVLLGAREPFPDLTLFSSTVYLGVTVDDGEPATADIEMRPRQAIVPVIAANYATNAGHAVQATNLVGGIPGAIPVGGITMYGGEESDLPPNWKICNGQRVRDAESPFDGKGCLICRACSSEVLMGVRDHSPRVVVIGTV